MFAVRFAERDQLATQSAGGGEVQAGAAGGADQRPDGTAPERDGQPQAGHVLHGGED